MAFKGNMSVELKASQAPAAGHSPDVVGSLIETIALSEGTGDNQAHKYVVNSALSVAGSTTITLDLQSLLDVYGAAVVGVELVGLAIKNRTGNGGDIEIKPNAADGFTGILKDATDILKVPVGGFLLWTNPEDGNHTIGASNKDLDITNTDGSAATIDTWLVLKTS